MTDNVKEFGVGAFNIDACRVAVAGNEPNKRNKTGENGGSESIFGCGNSKREATLIQGRHPANLLHDGSESVEAVFLEQSDKKEGRKLKNYNYKGSEYNETLYTSGKNKPDAASNYYDNGSASRFFNKLLITDLDAPFLYTAKPSKRERGMDNNHPTVKPIALMEWLIKLVTPEGGTTLDPFMGSGTTGIAAKKNNFNFIGMERETEYFEIAKQRIKSTKSTKINLKTSNIRKKKLIKRY